MTRALSELRELGENATPPKSEQFADLSDYIVAEQSYWRARGELADVMPVELPRLLDRLEAAERVAEAALLLRRAQQERQTTLEITRAYESLDAALAAWRPPGPEGAA